MSDTPEPVPPPPVPGPTRRLDAHSLRGLAHPLRMRLYELLSLDGPATATLLAQRFGENTGTVSWHLRQLAEHGFIEEDTARGTKRERWWRSTGVINDLRIADFRDDPDAHGPLSVYLRELVRQYFSRVMTYIGEDWDERWRNAGAVSDWRDLRMTPSQLRALNAELMEVIARHTPGPHTEPDPEALPVVVQLQSFPRRESGSA